MSVFLPTRFADNAPVIAGLAASAGGDVGGPAPETWNELFVDNFTIGGGSTNLALHDPDVRPAGVVWTADAGNFTLKTNTGDYAMTPDYGDMAIGPIAIYDSANIDLNSDASYPLRIEVMVGMRPDTGFGNNIPHRIVVRGTEKTANRGARNCWVLEYVRKVSGGVEVDSTLQFRRIAETRATPVEDGSIVTAVGIDNLVGNYRKLIIEDDGSTMSAWYDDAPSYVATYTSSAHSGQFIFGMGIGGLYVTGSGGSKHVWSYFKVLYQI